MKEIDVAEVLAGLGLSQLRTRNGNVTACCPNHTERRPSWGMSVKPPYVHACFSCHYKGTLATLLRDKFKWTESAIRDLIGTEHVAGSTEWRLADTTESGVRMESLPSEYLYPYYPVVSSPKALAYLTHERALLKQTILKASLLYDKLQQRIVFPWYWDSALYGLTGRSLRNRPGEAKLIAYNDFKKGNLFYLPSKRLPEGDIKQIVLVEGEIDALHVMQCGFTAMAVGQGNISKGQVRLLKSLPVNSLVFFFDNDETGARLTERAVDVFGSMCKTAIVPYPRSERKLDPAMLGMKQIKACLSRSEPARTLPALV